MKMKTSLQFILGVCVIHVASAIPLPYPEADPGRLLRVPRIYNALITSDAKLQPSRAYPYSTPVFQPVGLGPVPGVYSPVDGDLLDTWQPQDLQPQDLQPQVLPPQGFPPQGLPPQGLRPQNLPPQNFPPQNLPPQNLPPQNLAPQNLPPGKLPPQNLQPNIEQQPEEKPKSVAPLPTTAAPADSPKNQVEEVNPKSQKEKITHPLTFYPRSLGYYHPHPFLPYSYPLAPQPYVFGGPLGYNEHLYQYPTFGYDGYFGGGVFPGGIEQVSGVYSPTKAVEQPKAPVDTKKVDTELTEVDIKRKPSKEIGIRELEFLSDDQQSEIEEVGAPQDGLEKNTDIEQTS